MTRVIRLPESVSRIVSLAGESAIRNSVTSPGISTVICETGNLPLGMQIIRDIQRLVFSDQTCLVRVHGTLSGSRCIAR